MNIKFTGSFKTLDNTYTYNVTIGPSTGTSINIEDPSDNNVYEHPNDTHVMFASDPVTITCNRQDLTKRIIISQATINLVTNKNLTDELFADTNREIPVSIDKDGSSVFFGYVDPLQFDQGYAYHWENVQINATDPLGALEQLNVGDLDNIDASTQITSWDLIDAIFEAANISNFTDNINGTVKSAMQNTWFNLSQYFGKSEADWATLKDVLEDICKYWNLYISYYGNVARITCTINDNTSLISIEDIGAKTVDSNTSISVDDVYTKVELTCKIEPLPDTVISFDDDDYLYSNYNNYKRYMTELISEGNGGKALEGFGEMLNSPIRHSDHEDSYTIDNFLYVKQNNAWDFGPQGYTSLNYADQRQYLTWLKNNPGKAAIIGFGRSNKLSQRDNSPISNISIDNYLIISVCGNYDDSDAGGTYMENQLQANSPVCKYRGTNANVLTPPDSNTKNYIVFSGKILLNPLQKLTGLHWESDAAKLTNTLAECQTVFNSGWRLAMALLGKHTVPMAGSDNGAYYQQEWDLGTNGVYGYLNNKENHELSYDYSIIGDEHQQVDNISKAPVLACQLKVGNKYCVERLDLGEEGMGLFEWMTEDEFNTNIKPSMDQYAVPFFTIGIDPKINDYIVGDTYDIASNVNYTMNLDITGMAIPISLNDHLSGTIEMTILGPYNSIWKEIKKAYHGWTFWEHVHWQEGDHNILQHIQSVMIKDFKVDVTSDNGMISRDKTTANNDLIYASDMMPDYTEILEESVKVCTSLTTEEHDAWGIKNEISNSYIYKTNNEPFYGFQSGSYTIKPEECFVDYMYREYCTPSKIIKTSVRPDTFPNGPQGTWMNYEMTRNYITGAYPEDQGAYRIMSYSTELKKKKMNVTLREYKTQGVTQI